MLEKKKGQIKHKGDDRENNKDENRSTKAK